MADTRHITAELVRQLVRYEPDTGRIFWLPRLPHLFKSEALCARWNARFAEKEAFSATNLQGYRTGRIFGRTYRAHRVIWLIQTGEWPVGDVDHINGKCADNCWENLRDTSTSANMRNAKMWSHNTTGITGVVWDKRDHNWKAQIMVNKRQMYLGNFDRLEDAISAREAANIKFGFSQRHGL